jgi:hypothetical protein
MKYLKKYISFNEESEFDINKSDNPDLGMPKEKLNSLMSQIKEFKEKKGIIDQVYLKIKDDKELSDKIKEILGKEVSPKMDRNPFLVEYLNVSDLKRRLEKVKKDIVDDKLKLDDFNEELKFTSDSNQKSSIQQKISDINKRISLSNTSISKINSDIINAEKSLNSKMSSQEKNMKEYIKNIQSGKSK